MRGMGLLGSLLTVLVATGVIDHASGQNLPCYGKRERCWLQCFNQSGGDPAMAAAHADLYNMVSQLRLAVAATGNGGLYFVVDASIPLNDVFLRVYQQLLASIVALTSSPHPQCNPLAILEMREQTPEVENINNHCGTRCEAAHAIIQMSYMQEDVSFLDPIGNVCNVLNHLAPLPCGNIISLPIPPVPASPDHPYACLNEVECEDRLLVAITNSPTDTSIISTLCSHFNRVFHLMVGPGAVPLVQPTVNANINNYQPPYTLEHILAAFEVVNCALGPRCNCKRPWKVSSEVKKVVDNIKRRREAVKVTKKRT